MKNLVISFVLLIILTTAASFFLPWWTGAVLALILFFAFPANWIASFILGFLGIALVWGGYAWQIDSSNSSLLSARMGVLFNDLGPFQLIIITALVGGIGGGLGASTGSLARRLFHRPNSSS